MPCLFWCSGCIGKHFADGQPGLVLAKAGTGVVLAPEPRENLPRDVLALFPDKTDEIYRYGCLANHIDLVEARVAGPEPEPMDESWPKPDCNGL